MYCPQCGTRLGEDARFCAKCGTPLLQRTSHTGQPVNAAVENGPVAVQQPGGSAAPQEPYGGYVPQPPYGGYPPPGGYPPYGAQPAKRPMSKKAKALMWGGIGLAAVLAIVVVLVCVVSAGGGGLLSGNTVQTQFVNEAVKVFAGAFSDLSMFRMTDIGEQPFDMELSASVKRRGLSTVAKADVEMAYDLQTLGVAVDAGIARATLLMQEDTLYVDSGFDVTGVRLDSDADLSRPMSLRQRLAALTGSENGADIKRIAEAFVNSISADCFQKTGTTFTLELSEADMRDALEAFEEKLDRDKRLRDDLKDLLYGANVGYMLEYAISYLDGAEFDLTIEIGYRDGVPTALNVDIYSFGSFMGMAFEYEKRDNVTKITLDVADGGYSDAGVELKVKKVSGGLEIIGSMEASRYSYDFDGSIEKSGNTLSGSFDISDGQEKGTLGFEYTVNPGMPKKAVEKDRRFAIDTDDAEVQDVEDIMSFSSMSMWGMRSWY